MSTYFCTHCQRHRNNDWHPMSDNQICDGCEIEREERLRKMVAEGVAKTIEQNEKQRGVKV